MIRRLLATLAVIGIALPCLADDAAELVTTATVRGQTLLLADLGGQCAVTVPGQTAALVLDISAPCGFMATPGSTEAQAFTYDQILTVLWIAGPPSTPPDADLCSDLGQAIIVLAQAVLPQPGRMERATFCHRRGFDEKDFFAAAHDK